jgi:hypothetical protein
MAKRVFHGTNLTFAAQADATALATPYLALMCGAAAQRIEVNEIMVEGLASASAASFLQWARCSTNHTSATALVAPNSDGPMDPATAALAAPPVPLINATTGPSRSNATTDARLEVNINAYGGILRWNSGPDLKWILATITAPAAESVLSAYTGSTAAAISAHIIYEPL